jgi:hypothetical protein
LPKFTQDNTGIKKVDIIDLYSGGGDKRLYLANAKVNKYSDIALSSSNASIVIAKISKNPFNGPKGIWTIDLTPKAKGKAEIKAQVKASTATLKISIVEGLTLPPASGNEGLLVRLFLAESRSPDEASYNIEDSKKGMEWMELVLHNRLKNNPSQFGASKAKSITDIVKAKGQFKGFENYPNTDPSLLSRINNIFTLANSNNDLRQPKYRRFVENALAVAKPKLPRDPSPNGLYGWRTIGSGSPGGRFVAYGSALSGNQFYTLKNKD